MIDEEKRALRKSQRALLVDLSEERRVEAANALVAAAAPRLEGATRVALFASLPTEIDLGPLDAEIRARGIERALPRIEGGELVFHELPPDEPVSDLPLAAFRVPTPPSSWPVVELATCEVIFMPGLAFDRDGGRLGYGRGYYDRAVAALTGQGRLIGLGFREQIVDRVPTGEHDVPLDDLLAV
jgi:5-formyltetrahydrofolate cyclo-ligase